MDRVVTHGPFIERTSIMYECVKKNKRLWIRNTETDEYVYTPPKFINLQSREAMHELAAHMTLSGRYDINKIIDFEVRYGPRKKVPE
jgi:hypothetical protein